MSQTKNIIQFNSVFSNIKLFAMYIPERTSLRQLLNTLFDNYTVGETYIKECRNFNCVVFYSEKLKRFLDENDFDKRMSEFNFEKISTIQIMLKGDEYKMVTSVTEEEGNKRFSELINQLIKFQDFDENLIQTLNVKFLIGDNFTLKVLPTFKIEDIKLFIRRNLKMKIDLYQFRIVFNGNHCEDNKTLEECGINDKATVHCVLRLRGGSYDENSIINNTYCKLTPTNFIVTPDLNLPNESNKSNDLFELGDVNISIITAEIMPQSIHNDAYTSEYINYDDFQI